MSNSYQWMRLERERVIEAWADELAEYLGRPSAKILEDGLDAVAFPSNSSVDLLFEDGSSASFRYAFVLDSVARGLIAVFTEHCGYLIFPRGGVTVQTLSVQQK